MKTQLTYYLYNNIPGAWTGWTLAVLATGRKEANEYLRNVHRGGKFLMKIESGTVKADCGAVTPAAQEILRAKNEAE